MIVILILFSLLTILVSNIYFKLKRRYDLIEQIPGPPALPIIGNLQLFNVPIEKLWGVLRDINKNYYPITRIWLGPFPIIYIYHPDDLQVLLSNTTNLEKGFSYRGLRPWLKTGLLLSIGEKWHQRRKILTPAFYFGIMKKYLEITNENGNKFINVLRKEDKKTVQDLIPFCINYTLNIICESALGVTLDKVDDENAKQYKNAVFTMGHIIIYRTMRPYIKDWMLNPLIKLGRMQKQTLNTLHTFTDKVLVERKEYHRRTEYKYLTDFDNDKTHSDDLSIGRKKKLAMLDLLLKAEKDGLIDVEGIKEELDTFTLAGHETTGMALVYTLMLLAEHEEIQEKARTEVTRILNKNKGEMGLLEVQEFHYLERCIKESLRLFPPVSAISRQLEKDLLIRGYLIPAGTEVAIHIIDLHKDPNFWPEPEKFDPDRFLPEKIHNRHPYSYLPFSAGPRNCIGQKFALMELKCLIALILYNFELKTVTKRSDVKIKLDIVTRPSAPIYVKFVRIDNNNN